MTNRRKSLTESDRVQFVQDATEAHHRLCTVPDCPHTAQR